MLMMSQYDLKIITANEKEQKTQESKEENEERNREIK